MSAMLRAAVAGVFMFEISAAFFMGLSALILFTLHVTGSIFWGVEAMTALGALYVSSLFFMSALKYERQAQTVDLRSN
ncbi:MAG: hypothetical protein CME84_04250 [Henriciella sp.]|uniref:hypothetical protein n=1 Tax=uncultured Henriciella sp. TaxID=1608424 RepID=UPI000C538163|nr:hypothetical protein [Henriciella sp.]MAN73285.1 hypothetical protein [Henriciella sp.]MBF33019.1 hypothetical protein [Hyphomonadaceae bacterium]